MPTKRAIRAMNGRLPDGCCVTDPRKGGVSLRLPLVLLSVLSMIPSLSGAQTFGLVPDRDDLLNNRTPLILIHGLCGSQDETWDHEDDGFLDYFDAHSDLRDQFKLYYFNYPANVNLPIDPSWFCKSPALGLQLTPADVRRQAGYLQLELNNDTEMGPLRHIAIVAHSLGGLLARSFMQELGGHTRTEVLVTLATPHHGALLASTPSLNHKISAMWWDRYDDNSEGDENSWLRCLNGIAPGNRLCRNSDSDTLKETFAKIVTVSVVKTFDYKEGRGQYPDDWVVQLQGSVFAEPRFPIRRRYTGFGGFNILGAPPSYCKASQIAHTAIHHQDCSVNEVWPEVDRVKVGVFAVIEKELLTRVVGRPCLQIT